MRDDDSSTAAPFVPARARSLRRLAQAVQGCRGCELYRNGTRAVFGEGPGSARIVLVGEQPGDQEERRGRPFVGPAGRLLDDALQRAGIDRDVVYVTNVVKHFRYAPRGKRRMHKKPTVEHVRSCLPWLEAEVDRLHPELAIALGATAAQAMLGRDFQVSKQRGQLVRGTRWADVVTATVHPSSVVRLHGKDGFDEAFEGFWRDLEQAARAV